MLIACFLVSHFYTMCCSTEGYKEIESNIFCLIVENDSDLLLGLVWATTAKKNHVWTFKLLLYL